MTSYSADLRHHRPGPRYLLRDGRNVHPEPLCPFLQLINVHLKNKRTQNSATFQQQDERKVVFSETHSSFTVGSSTCAEERKDSLLMEKNHIATLSLGPQKLMISAEPNTELSGFKQQRSSEDVGSSGEPWVCSASAVPSRCVQIEPVKIRSRPADDPEPSAGKPNLRDRSSGGTLGRFCFAFSHRSLMCSLTHSLLIQ